MKREVALKIISPRIVGDASSVRRFNREVEAAARLTHPNIVTAYDAGEAENVHYLVMEYVVGSDLTAIVRRQGALSLAGAVDCTLQAARGLAYAHEAGIIHRDIKPSNLLVDTAGTVKVLDMGLARLEANQESAALQGLTHTGMMMGTVDYMAPEQAFDSKTADARSDIYSLGCTLYFLVAGRAMYPGETVVQRILAHREHLIPDLPASTRAGVDEKVWQRLNKTFQRMVAKTPEERFATMHEVVEALETIRGDLGEAGPIIHPGDSEVSAPPTIGMEPTAVIEQAELDTHSSAQQEETVALTRPPRPQPATAPPAPATSENRPPPRNRRRLLLSGGGMAAMLLLTILTFRFRGEEGKVVVELDSPVALESVEVDGNEVAFTQAGSNNRLRFHADPGSHEFTLKLTDGLKLTTSLGRKPLQIQAGDTTRVRAWVEKSTIATKEFKWNLPAGAPAPAIAPFTAEQAKNHQAEWAEYLGMPVEKDIHLENGVMLTMTLIPPGEFVMGSHDKDRNEAMNVAYGRDDKWAIERIPSEGPPHRVAITEFYYLSRYEITQAQWMALMDGNPSPVQPNPHHPVDAVNWFDCNSFAEALNTVATDSQLTFSLPSEAQWEFACRAGTTSKWYFGDEEDTLGEHAWFSANGSRQTHPVGELSANPFGLCDMHGNVWEWCIDYYEFDYYSNSPVQNPTGPPRALNHALRGGCWINTPIGTRSASRNFKLPETRNKNGIGMRLAASLR